MRKFKLVSMAVVALAITGPQAFAADLDPIFSDDANLMRPAELGSGWYLRGDIAYNFGLDLEQVAGSTPNGIGTLETETSDGIAFGVGVGKQINRWLRADVIAERAFFSETSQEFERQFGGSRSFTLGSDPTPYTIVFDENGNVLSNNCPIVLHPECDVTTINAIDGTETFEAEYSAWNVLANGYIDLPSVGKFRPYIGGGGGGTRVAVTSRQVFDCNVDAGEACLTLGGEMNETITNFVAVDGTNSSWLPTATATAGVTMDLTKNIALDLGYRYTHTFGLNDKLVENGVTEISDSDGIHSVKMGVRFSAW